ncbi:hypothetical protein C8J56DRAFT_943779 [Mycena floridula]|nr:hypothetical protein C8J56DRAFT_943779 [Mycena floridula]
MKSSKLRQVILHCMEFVPENMDYSQFLDCLPRESLQSVVIQECDVERASKVLSGLPRPEIECGLFLRQRYIIPPDSPLQSFILQHLNISIAKIGDSRWKPPYHPHCRCPQKSIDTCNCPFDALQHLFFLLTLPALKSLQIQHDLLGLIPWPMAEFTQFMSRSELSDQLTSLTLRDIAISDEELIQTLQLTSNLQMRSKDNELGCGICSSYSYRRG